jgi:hypothetical protein
VANLNWMLAQLKSGEFGKKRRIKNLYGIGWQKKALIIYEILYFGLQIASEIWFFI